MDTSSLDFSTYTQWLGILTLICLVLTILGFVFGWGIRFRLVGVTSFMVVLTAGIFALGLGLFTRTVVPGAVRFALVYDNGATQAVIAVPPKITESELEATLRQAADDLFSYGRNSIGGENQLTIRARVLLHPESGVSVPVYVGQVKRSLAKRDDDQMQIEIFPESLAKLEMNAKG
ncbi:MAG: Ycf51 family protein [Hydrococcus sp. C42_A2020_068]|uniref:Ycf51 family protein n=1 Tax=Pleurocapsa sp. PCC 7327 TaxID=118163 RepID=UPI00029FCA14|nr:Ycf51 family protein [Pleurocapsa sp. PCC 7327]AFY78615.1 Protein of function (DUF2518) [Pleurocapsa sp. PCC 7327]MBF2018679.1 Ycf51 family protein [Hydrococcus sp. C42_A2020_068]